VLGAGISGMMGAFALYQAGFDVSIYAKGPDPRKDHSAEQFSSTGNGELGRFVSRFEGEHYLGDTPMYPDMAGAFKRHVAEGGWLGKYQDEWDEFDRLWLKKRWKASKNKESMNKTERHYIEANGKAMELWQNLIIEFPDFFEDVDLLNTGIIKIFDNKELFEWAVKRHKKRKCFSTFSA